MRLAGAPWAVSSRGTSVVRSAGEAGDRQSGGDDVAVLAKPLGEDARTRGDDRGLLAVGAPRPDAGAAGHGLALGQCVRAGEDALARRDDDVQVGGVFALPVLRAAGNQR